MSFLFFLLKTHLRCHISRSSFSEGFELTLSHFGLTEIDYDRSAIFKHDILRLYVPVSDILFMDLADSWHNLIHQIQFFLKRRQLIFVQIFWKIYIEELHDKGHKWIIQLNLIAHNWNYVWMLQFSTNCVLILKSP